MSLSQINMLYQVETNHSITAKDWCVLYEGFYFGIVDNPHVAVAKSEPNMLNPICLNYILTS